jgi:hypothetical protein
MGYHYKRNPSSDNSYSSGFLVSKRVMLWNSWYIYYTILVAVPFLMIFVLLT